MPSRSLSQTPVLPRPACVLPLTALPSPFLVMLALGLLPLELPLKLTWASHFQLAPPLGSLVGGSWEEVAHSPDWGPKTQSGLQQASLHGQTCFPASPEQVALPHTLFSLLAAPSLQSSVRQRLTEPQHGLGSQRLVEGEAGHFLTSRVSLRRMRSLSSGQSFSSEGLGTSTPPASASSSCSSAAATTTTTTSITTVHVHPVYYHHSTSYFLQMEPYPDPPPSDSSTVMPWHSESLGYQLSLFSPFLPVHASLLPLLWPLPAGCCLVGCRGCGLGYLLLVLSFPSLGPLLEVSLMPCTFLPFSLWGLLTLKMSNRPPPSQSYSTLA